MQFKEFYIWAFWGQNVGLGWVKNRKKRFFHTSHLSANPVLPKNEIFIGHSVTLSKLKYELTDLHKILQKFIFY